MSRSPRYRILRVFRGRTFIPATLLLLLLFAGTAHTDGYRAVSAAELARWLEAGQDPPLLLDASGAPTYRTATVREEVGAGTDPAAFTASRRIGPVVLILPEPQDPQQREAWVDRLQAAGYVVHVLEGGLPAWHRAGLAAPSQEDAFVRPGTVPFVIPRGLCETKKPIHIFR